MLEDCAKVLLFFLAIIVIGLMCTKLRLSGGNFINITIVDQRDPTNESTSPINVVDSGGITFQEISNAITTQLGGITPNEIYAFEPNQNKYYNMARHPHRFPSSRFNTGGLFNTLIIR